MVSHETLKNGKDVSRALRNRCQEIRFIVEGENIEALDNSAKTVLRLEESEESRT